MDTGILLVYAYIFYTGCCFGSFFNVCIDRLPKGQSIAKPRSHCTCCGRFLGILDLFPVFSYLFLKGKCRYCGAKLPFRYMLLELLWGVVFVAGFSKYLLSYRTVLCIMILSYCLIIGMIERDMKKVRPAYLYPIAALPFAVIDYRSAAVIVLGSVLIVYIAGRGIRKRWSFPLTVFALMLVRIMI